MNLFRSGTFRLKNVPNLKVDTASLWAAFMTSSVFVEILGNLQKKSLSLIIPGEPNTLCPVVNRVRQHGQIKVATCLSAMAGVELRWEKSVPQKRAEKHN